MNNMVLDVFGGWGVGIHKFVQERGGGGFRISKKKQVAVDFTKPVKP